MATSVSAATATAPAPVAQQPPEAAQKQTCEYHALNVSCSMFENMLKRISYSIPTQKFYNLPKGTRIIQAQEYELAVFFCWKYEKEMAATYTKLFPEQLASTIKKCLAIAAIYLHATIATLDPSASYRFILHFNNKHLYTMGIVGGRLDKPTTTIADTKAFVPKLKAKLEPLIGKNEQFHLANIVKNRETIEKILKEFGVDLNLPKLIYYAE